MVVPQGTFTPTLSEGIQAPSAWYSQAMEQLVHVVQDLSHARDLSAVGAIVRDAARNLTGADGATFVLRDNDQCYYADENAVSPLWKGRRFPMKICISGWVMANAEQVVIEDIYKDSRVPADAYRPTFVKSLAMVPIRRESPIGAIGNYWAEHRTPTKEEMAILQALADTTSVAIENAHLYSQLQEKIRALQESNYELSRFAWVASHDLQEPLRTIATQVELLEKKMPEAVPPKARQHVRLASDSARRLQELIEALLVHAQAEKVEDFRPVELSELVSRVKRDVINELNVPEAEITATALPRVLGDEKLLARVFHNLLCNGIKFQQSGNTPCIHIECRRQDNEWLFSIQDNGIGIEMDYLQRIFGFFQRLHSQERYPGSGVGLATCKKTIELHGGRIWAESRTGQGSTFFFTLPAGWEAQVL